MIIKIDTGTSDDRGIPVIVDDKTIRYIKNPEALKMLQLLLEDLNDSRKEVEEKEEWIEQLLEMNGNATNGLKTVKTGGGEMMNND